VTLMPNKAIHRMTAPRRQLTIPTHLEGPSSVILNPSTNIIILPGAAAGQGSRTKFSWRIKYGASVLSA
jgi:hypothetical protein